MALKNKKENFLWKWRHKDSPENMVNWMFIHEEKNIYLENWFEKDIEAYTIWPKIMTKANEFLLGEDIHWERISLWYYADANSRTTINNKWHNSSKVHPVFMLIKNIHTSSDYEFLLNRLEFQLNWIDKIFEIKPDEECNNMLWNPWEIKINTTAEYVRLFDVDNIFWDIEYFYDRFSAVRKIKLVFRSKLKWWSNFSDFYSKIIQIVDFFQFWSWEWFFISDLIWYKTLSGTMNPIIINIFDHKYFLKEHIDKVTQRWYKNFTINNVNKDSLKSYISRRSEINNEIWIITSSYLFYSWCKEVWLQDFFLWMTRCLESLHRILFKTKAVKEWNNDNIKKISKAITDLWFQNDQEKYYKQIIESTLKHNEIPFVEKLSEIKWKYNILDEVVTNKELDVIKELRNDLTHKKSKDIDINKLYSISTKTFYFMRESLLFLICN